ncbi:MAG: UDP-3-O-(3-hydroxymyristoyl)glucosamine N-acyltransferase [Longimicrobiales bacterium]|nr:UDP-3-O-(3-hydroxymyristoyl)glucosamine N-acyltransferase [Longimicrobiales bacterium]
MTRTAAAPPPPLTLGAVAALVGGRLDGDPRLPVAGVAPVREAEGSQIAFVAAKRYGKHVAASRAGSFLVSEAMAAFTEGRPRVVVGDAQCALVTLLRHLHPAERGPVGVHPSAVLGPRVHLGADVYVGPYAVLDDDVSVGDGSRVGAHVVLGRGARMGRECTLYPHVVLYPGTRLGDRVIVHSGTVLGADGFGYAFFDGAHQRIPHLGKVILGNDVEIGANSAVDRGSLGDTVVEEGVKVDNLVQIAYNVQVGAHSMMAALVGVAGSTHIGKGVWMGGQAGVIDHLEISDGARLAVASKVFRDVPPGETVSGHPARPHREDLSRQAHLGRLPRLLERVKALEAEVEALRNTD